MKLLLMLEAEEVCAEYLHNIEALVPSMEVIVVGKNTSVPQVALADAEIIAGWVTREAICNAPNLRWAQHWAAGVDSLTRDPDIQMKDFVLTNGSGVHGIPIREHILAFLLTFARGFHHQIRAQQRRAWRPLAREEIFELAGKTLLLIGVGAIGEAVAQVADALGMYVLGARRDPSQTVTGIAKMFGPAQLLEALPQADFVVLTVPMTEETCNMIGERELRAMQTHAYLINIGRGGTIDEAALARALREGWIAGAGLDVFETEPLPDDSPLWDMDNIIITAHYAGNTPQYAQRAMDIFLDNLRRYQNGKPLRNVVDKALGY